jgi:hypothetical protein
MLRKIHRAIRLTPADWATLAAASILLLQADLHLRRSGFARTRALFRPDVLPEPTAPLTPSQRETVARLAYLVDVAARYHVLAHTCLTRSLALQRLLARAGVRTSLRVGVRKAEGQAHAHAWLERDGQLVAEPPEVEDRFAALLPASALPELLAEHGHVQE